MLIRTSSALCITLLLQLAWADIAEDDERAKPARGPNYSVYNFVINDVQGKPVDFKQFKGKVILVVNVASECGFTDGHYRGLQDLHKLLSLSERFSVVAFPCNQFGGQEPKTNKEIHEFATKNYGTTFPILEKVDVTGRTAHDLWKLIEITTGQPPNWNFWKYLVDYQGNVINYWGPWNTVEEITPFLKEAVDQAVKEFARKRQANESAGMPSTAEQFEPDSMSRAPPLPLHRARPPPPPKIPAPPKIEAPPPPDKTAPKTPRSPPKPPSTSSSKKGGPAKKSSSGTSKKGGPKHTEL